MARVHGALQQLSSLEVPLSENPGGVSGATRVQRDDQLDPKGVLQMVAQWAASATDAHGAAIAVGDAAGMCCGASFGNAPVVRTPLSSTSGLSGICLRTSQLVQCDDTEIDPRVDAVACRQLNLRSVLVVPVLVDSSIRALIEVFSSKPHAFNAGHRRDLMRMAHSLAPLLAEGGWKPAASVDSSITEKATLSTQVEAAAKPADVLAPTFPGSFTSAKAAPVTTCAKVMPASAEPVAPSAVTGRSFFRASKFVYASLLVSLVFLFVVGWYLVGRRRTSAPMVMNAGASTSQNKTGQALAEPEITFDQSALSVTAPVEGKRAQGTTQDAQLTPGKLIRRVDPTYPPAARDSGIGGSVVLTAIVSRTGAVENVKFVRGPEPLAEAATEAVRRWSFEPYRQNGEPVAVQTTIIVKFAPPKRP